MGFRTTLERPSPLLGATAATTATLVLLLTLFAWSHHSDPAQEQRRADEALAALAPATTNAETAARQLRTRQMEDAVRHAQQTEFRGSLVLATEPEGAFVTVNGTDSGSTPVTITGLRPGHYLVNLYRDGFSQQELVLEPSAEPKPAPAIRLVRQTGMLRITTQPEGLPVRIELSTSLVPGESFEPRTTVAPADLTLPTGWYDLQSERDGYSPRGTTTHVEAGQTSTVVLSLLPARVEISSTPTGAEVFLGEEKVGTTPYVLEAKENIFGAFVLRLAGHEESTIYASAEMGETSHREVRLTPVEAPAESER